jgi:hypothetical protein
MRYVWFAFAWIAIFLATTAIVLGTRHHRACHEQASGGVTYQYCR